MNNKFSVKMTNVTKSFENNEVIKSCNLNIEQGKIYGLLGMNGSGKTTIFKLLIGLLSPDIGSIEILGQDIKKHNYNILKDIGSIIEFPVFYDHLSAYYNLKIHLDYMNMDGKIDSNLKLVGLENARDTPISKFSLGMKQRLGIARALIHKPKLLILDEPVNGLDPVGIRELRDIFNDIAHTQNITILVSSHILSEIENICDKVGILVGGSISEEMTISDIKQKFPQGGLEDYFFSMMKGEN